jgi:hypothetical protein
MRPWNLELAAVVGALPVGGPKMAKFQNDIPSSNW